MRQQLADPAGSLPRQALHHVLQVGGVVSIDSGRVHQAHDRGGALARA
jgi:hypothetical protein